MTLEEIDAVVRAIYGPSVVQATAATPDTPQAQADTAAAMAKEAAMLNETAKAVYLSAFGNWSALVRAGKIPEQDPPKPPNGVISVAASNGWSFIIPDTNPVTPMPPEPILTSAPSGVVIAIGQHLVGAFWAALPTNSIPVGTPMPVQGTSTDGNTGPWTWDASPFGGWWENTTVQVAAPPPTAVPATKAEKAAAKRAESK